MDKDSKIKALESENELLKKQLKTAKNTQQLYLELKEKYILLSKIVNLSPFVLLILKNSDPRKIEFISDSISQFGYDSEDMLKNELTFADIIYEKDFATLKSEIDKYVEFNADEFYLLTRLVSSDGDIRWVEAFFVTIKNDKDEITHLQGFFMDITEKKNSEESLLSSLQKKNLILEAVPDLILRFDCNGFFLDYHSPPENSIIENPEAVIGEHIYDILHPKIANEIVSNVMTAFNKNRLHIFKFEFSINDKLFVNEARILPSSNDDFFVMIRDLIS